jgi:hypothetical protein
MGFKLRKTFKIAPGVKLNLSKSGLSTSIGGRGHTVNVGKKGVRATVGIPGSGLSYSKSINAPKTPKLDNTKKKGCCLAPASAIICLVIAVTLIIVI